MIWQLDLAILTLVVIASIGTIMVRDLLGARHPFLVPTVS